MKVIKVNCLMPIRLDKYLMEQFSTLSVGRLNKALRENKIKLNGKKQPLSTRVQMGDEIKLFIPDQQLGLVEPSGPSFLRCAYPAKVVYEDEQLLIVNKPAGLPVSDDLASDTLIQRVLLHLYNKGEYIPGKDFEPQLCHRLDTGTSGLVLVAKTARSLSLLTALIKERSVKKEYLCVTFGRPKPEKATLNDYLSKDAEKGRVRIGDKHLPDAKPIETRYETLSTSGRLALLRVELITGRTHQIRAHLASIGCPILGDSKYGNNNANREFRFKYQALCAWRLTFPILPDPELSGISGKSFRAEQPWYCAQLLEGKLK